MQSETHRMLVRAVGQKHNKVARLRMAPDPTQDPEREKMELMKQTSKSKPKRQKTEDDGFGNPRAKRKPYSRKRSGDGVWSDDEEEAAYDMYGGESDEDQDLDGGPGRRAARKAGARSSGDARKGSEYQTDDFVVSDSPSDADSESGKRSKRKMADRGQSDEDDLDKLDAKIEQQEEAERKRGQVGMEEDHPEPEEMDVESEEPDEGDEHQVRKAGGKRRRLAVVGFEEDEE